MKTSFANDWTALDESTTKICTQDCYDACLPLMPGLSYTHLNVRWAIFEMWALPLCVGVQEMSKVNCGRKDDNGQRESHDDYVQVNRVMSLVTM